jgi:hypothetical protein
MNWVMESSKMCRYMVQIKRAYGGSFQMKDQKLDGEHN